MMTTTTSDPIHEDAPELFHCPDAERDASVVAFLDGIGFTYRERIVTTEEIEAGAREGEPDDHAGLPTLVWSGQVYPNLTVDQLEEILHAHGYQFEDS